MLEMLLPTSGKIKPPIAPGWVRLADLGFSRYYSGAVAIGETIVTTAGFSNDITPNGADARTFTYGVTQDTWTPDPLLPVKRFDGGFAVLDDRLYVCGGRGTDYLGDLRSYEPATNTWRLHFAVLTPRYRMAMTSTGGKLYLFGGWTTVEMADLQEFDPVTGVWTKIATAPFTRQKAIMVGIGTKLYIHGGNTDTNSKELWCYDLTKPDVWVRLADCPTVSQEFSMATLNGLIYVYGGNVGGISTVPRIYNPTTNQWTTGLPGGPGGRLGCMVLVDKSFYLFSSMNTGGVGTKEVWRYTP